MALTVGELRALITVDEKGATQGLRRFEGQAQQTESRVTGAAKRMGTALAGAFAGVSIGQGIASAIMAAADLEAAASTVEQTFGDASATIKQFAAGAADSLGLSERAALEASTTFGIFGKTAGLSGEELAGFSINMVKLAGDLAAFKNVRPEEAITALGAAMRGEYDPMEQFGVILNEGVLKQRALKDGIIETNSQALTPQQRILVAYQAILEGTTTQQGQLARESEQLGTKLNQLRARAEDNAAAFGQRLLPAASAVVGFLGGPGIDAVSGIANGLLDVLAPLGAVAKLFGQLPGPVQAAILALVAFRVAQATLGTQAAGLGQQLVQPWRNFGEAVRVQTALAASEGAGNIGRLAASMAVLESRIPIIGRMADAYRQSADAARHYVTAQSLVGTTTDAAVGPMGRLSGSLDRVTVVASGAASALGVGLRGAMGGLSAALGGPWGIAIAGAVAALGLWQAQSQRAKQEQQELAAASRTVADAIAESNGVINESVRATASQQLEQQGLLKTMDQLGASLPKVTDGFLGNADAADEVRAHLQGIIDRNKQMATTEFGGRVWTGGLTEQGIVAKDALGTFNAMIGSLGANAEGQDRVAAATDAAADSNAQAAEKASALQEALAGIAEGAGTAEDQISALADAILGLSGETLSVEEATQMANDAIRDLGEGFTLARDEAAAAGQGILDAAGGINTATEAGSKLFDTTMGLRDAFAQQYAATYQAAIAMGKSVPEAAAAATAASAGTRQAFIDAAIAAGLGADAAVELANRYGLVPEAVATQVQQPGMAPSLAALTDLRGRVIAVPNDKTIIVSSTSDAEKRKLEQLGFTVRTLPNGDVEIVAHTGAAEDAINRVARNRTSVITVITNTGRAYRPTSGGRAYQAEGGIMEYWAGGGMRPMRGNWADIVQSWTRTGVQRVIGDNPRHDEAYIPLDPGSGRSQAILDQVLHRMRPGWDAVGRALQGALRGAIATVPPDDDSFAGNSYHSPNRGRSGAVQFEDGSWGFRDGQTRPSRGDIHLHAVPSVPTIQQLRDLLHEIEVLYA